MKTPDQSDERELQDTSRALEDEEEEEEEYRFVVGYVNEEPFTVAESKYDAFERVVEEEGMEIEEFVENVESVLPLVVVCTRAYHMFSAWQSKESPRKPTEESIQFLQAEITEAQKLAGNNPFETAFSGIEKLTQILQQMLEALETPLTTLPVFEPQSTSETQSLREEFTVMFIEASVVGVCASIEDNVPAHESDIERLPSFTNDGI